MKQALLPVSLICTLGALALAGPGHLIAQQALVAVTRDAPYTPLTLRQKYKYSLNKMFSPGALFAVTMHAAFQQAETQPHDWGQGSNAFGVRYASLLGRSLVRQNVAFGVRAMDHEDPRYFLLGHGTPWQRTKYAIVHTFVVRRDDGGTMPAYSRFVAAFSMPFVAQAWGPAEFRTLPEGFRSGILALSTSTAASLAQEFWPDLKRRLERTRLYSRWSR